MLDDTANREPQVYGLVAEYDNPDQLLNAARSTYDAGYREVEAYSPFPIHGLAESLGFTKTAVPFLTLCAGLTGAIAGFGMQVFATVYHYPYEIGGRPLYSWPAYIPITFETMVLFAAFAAGLSMIALNGLPRPHHSIFNAKNFDRASSDRFFLCIESADERYDVAATKEFMEGLDPKPLEVSEVIV